MKKDSSKSMNTIKESTQEAKASTRLLSLWVEVDYTTVSKWNTNKFQPSDENLSKIGELLELDRRDLLASEGRKKTGLAKALQAEMKYLHLNKGIPYEIEHFHPEKKRYVMINNPEMMIALKEFAERYKLRKLAPRRAIYIDKPLDKLSLKEIRGKTFIICKAKSAIEHTEFNYLVVDLTKRKKRPVARFVQQKEAEEYIKQRML